MAVYHAALDRLGKKPERVEPRFRRDVALARAFADLVCGLLHHFMGAEMDRCARICGRKNLSVLLICSQCHVTVQ